MQLERERCAVAPLLRHLGVHRLARGDRAQECRIVRRSRPASRHQRSELGVAVAVHLPQRRIGVDDRTGLVEQRESVDRCAEHRPILLLARTKRRFGGLAVGDVACEREDAVLAVDGHALAEYLVPAQAAVLVPAVPLDGKLLAGGRACHQVDGIGAGEGAHAGTERADVEAAEFFTAVTERRARLRIGVDDRAGVDVVHEDRVLRCVEDRAIAHLRRAQRLVHARTLGNVAAQPVLRIRDLERHRVEGAAQPAELVAAGKAAARAQIARRELLGRVHELRRAAGEDEVKDQPHRERQRRHPARPVERLLHDLRARLGLVAAQVVGQEHGAGPRGAQLGAVATDQNLGVTEQIVAVGHDHHARAPLAHGLQVDVRQRVRDRASDQRAPCRGDHYVAVVGHRREPDVVVMREHGNLALRRRAVALQQQIFERALQPRHLLSQPLASVFLGHPLGLRDVVEQVHRGQRRGETQQQQRDRELERNRQGQAHAHHPAARLLPGGARDVIA